jgi:hypothetical protein
MDFLNNQPPIDPTANNPLNKFLMPTAGQQAAQQPPQQQAQVNPDTQALIEALRKGGMGGGGAPAQAGRVQTTGYFGEGMTDPSNIGSAIRGGYDRWNNPNPNGMTQPEMMNLMSDFGG